MKLMDELMAELQPQTRYALEENQRAASAINRTEPMRGMFYDSGLVSKLAYIGKDAGDEVSLAYLDAMAHCPAGQMHRFHSSTFVDKVKALPVLGLISQYGTDESAGYQAIERAIESFLR